MLFECPNCGYQPCSAPGCTKHGNIDGMCSEHFIEQSAKNMVDAVTEELETWFDKDD